MIFICFTEKKKIKIIVFAPSTDLVSQLLKVIMKYVDVKMRAKVCLAS